MKKLMIAAAIVCAAAISQAATIDWGLTAKNTIKTATGADGAGINVYLFDSAAATWATTLAGLKDGTINADNITGYLGTGTTGTSGASLGKAASLTATVANPGVEFSKLVFVAFDKVTADSGDIKAGDYFYLSGTKTGKSYDGSPDYPSGVKASWTSTDYAQSNWTKVESVPEPTSGLLLVLGIAGLALRRRRA